MNRIHTLLYYLIIEKLYKSPLKDQAHQSKLTSTCLLHVAIHSYLRFHQRISCYQNSYSTIKEWKKLFHSAEIMVHQRVEDFCQNTSLHGWGFCFRPGKPKFHTALWISVQVFMGSIIAVVLIQGIKEFKSATVSYELESSSTSLESVVFPAVAICNMNFIRKSFVYSVLGEFEKVCSFKVIGMLYS